MILLWHTVSRYRRQEYPTATIGSLGALSVYRRSNGLQYLKINDQFHFRAKIDGKYWVGDGLGEELDPNEVVTIVVRH